MLPQLPGYILTISLNFVFSSLRADPFSTYVKFSKKMVLSISIHKEHKAFCWKMRSSELLQYPDFSNSQIIGKKVEQAGGWKNWSFLEKSREKGVF